VKFVFATTDPRKVPMTVLSRCQRFDLRRVLATELIGHFRTIAAKEGFQIEPEALALIARAADGSVRDGLSLLDQAIALTGAGEAIAESAIIDMLGLADRGLVFDMMAALLKGIPARALEIFDNASGRGADPGMVLQDLLEFIHAITRVKTLPAAGNDLGLSEQEFKAAKILADQLSIPTLGRAWQMLLKGIGEVETAPDRRAAAEMVLIRLCHVAELPTPGELVRQLSEGRGSGTGPLPNPPPRAGEGEGPSYPLPLAGEGGPASAGGGGAAQALAPVAAPAPPQLGSFRDLARLVAERREAMLHAHLVNSVHLVRFAPPVIEIRTEPDAPRDLAGRLANLLHQATGVRWTIALSAAPGEPTLAEQGKAAAGARRAAAAEHPLVRAILDAFPGARLDAVRDSATDPYGLPLEPPPLAGESADDAEYPDNSRWEQEQ